MEIWSELVKLEVGQLNVPISSHTEADAAIFRPSLSRLMRSPPLGMFLLLVLYASFSIFRVQVYTGAWS